MIIHYITLIKCAFFTVYVQQIGRAGRDDTDAMATMLINSSDIATNVQGLTESMRKYCKTTTCRRKELCNFFGYKIVKQVPKCCDNCVGTTDDQQISKRSSVEPSSHFVPDDIVLLVEEGLSSYVSLDETGCLSQQLTSEVIKSLAKSCRNFSTSDELGNFYSLKPCVAQSVFAVISTILSSNNINV
jgi:hypothetical protein